VEKETHGRTPQDGGQPEASEKTDKYRVNHE
jgi:hypothetical protein